MKIWNAHHNDEEPISIQNHITTRIPFDIVQHSQTFKQNYNIEILHNNGVYIGNNHFVKKSHISFLCKVLDQLIIK